MLTAADYMRLALAAAAQAQGRTHPNPPVGCVLVRGRRVIGTGHTQPAGQAHAEVAALRQAGPAARGADVYVTLEPCAHLGRTGACAEALVLAGVRRVFVGMSDPNPQVNGRGLRRLRRAGIEVQVGLLAADCAVLNRPFVACQRRGRVWVVGKVAQSLDGRVASASGASRWITGVPARRRGHALRDRYDAILVGSGTVRADDPRLTCRLRGGRDPIRIVLDSQARLSPTAQVLAITARSRAPTWVVVGENAPLRRCQALRRAGAEVLSCPLRGARLDLVQLMRQLCQRGLSSVLVEGGPTVLGALRDAALLDELYVFLAPRLLGGVGARAALAGDGAQALVEAPYLRQLQVEALGRDWLLHGIVAAP